MDGCIAVTKVDNLQKLMKYICKNGFEHHVAMCRTDVVDILNEAIGDLFGLEPLRSRVKTALKIWLLAKKSVYLSPIY